MRDAARSDAQHRHGRVFATLGVAMIQLVTVLVVLSMSFWDSFANESSARLPLAWQLVHSGIWVGVLFTAGAMILGYIMDRSSMWAPLVGAALTIAAYVVARGILYS